MATDLLPDSRLRQTRGGVYGRGAFWVPVFCAACGKPRGYVPEAFCTFACWLCDDCVETHGAAFATMLMPDEVFWARVRQEQIEEHGRELAVEEVRELQLHGTTPLAHLLREGV